MSQQDGYEGVTFFFLNSALEKMSVCLTSVESGPGGVYHVLAAP